MFLWLLHSEDHRDLGVEARGSELVEVGLGVERHAVSSLRQSLEHNRTDENRPPEKDALQQVPFLGGPFVDA